jgi:hypothetical protein
MQKTHMPFYSDGTIIFCTNDNLVKRRFQGRRHFTASPQMEYRPWKLAYANWADKNIALIPTGTPNDAILCNPTFHRHGEELHISFIAGIPHEEGIAYRLYEMSGTSWQNLSTPQQVGEEFAKTGFVSSEFYCLGDTNRLTLLNRRSHERLRITTSLREISRAIYDPEQPLRLLITGIDVENKYVTLLFDTATQSVSEIRGPAPSYKACLVGSRIVFSYKESDATEDYQLHIAPALFEPTTETVQMVGI